jgi:hypothetical protein
MFNASKPTASLSSGLLARKGQARPAMRPQGFHGHSMNLEDLGWNDMGEGFAAPEPVIDAIPPVTEVPPVLLQREMLREEIVREPEPEVGTPIHPEPRPVSVATASRIQREVQAGKPKAAFTLRLDIERHLRLRLASATRNRSAQSLVTEALDTLLTTLPEVEKLARQLPQLKAVRSSGDKR